MLISIVGTKCYFSCDDCQIEFERPKCRSTLEGRHYCCKQHAFSRKCSEETKKKTSEAMRGEKNHFFGKTHNSVSKQKMAIASIGHITSEETKQKLRDLNTGEKNGFFGKTHDVVTRKKMSETRSRKIAAGELRSGPRGRQGLYTSLKTGVEERYDSFYELFRMWLLDKDHDVVTWTKRHGITIAYEWEGFRSYVPDFKIETKNGIVIEEIKGYENPEKLSAKKDALLCYCKNKDFEMSFLDFETLNSWAWIYYDKSLGSLRNGSSI